MTEHIDSIPKTISSAREFPSIEILIQSPIAREYEGRLARPLIAAEIKDAVAELKKQLSKHGKPVSGEVLGSSIRDRLEMTLRRSIGRVINATGIVVHTNLGRAPLSEEMFEHIKHTVTGYGNIEFDVSSGKRGNRGELCERLLGELSGAESGTVVNNCAAALFVMLNTLANRREVVLSRGEMVQIGGGFRIPDILKRSGAKLTEVGTTNITTFKDYENAVTDKTALILKVHKSNFVQAGFTEEVPLKQLVALGKRRGIPVINDLGSGVFVSTRELLGYHEPTVQESVRDGAALTSFSGDKMLGGGQAGLIVGQRELVEKIKKNPIFRALRVDKIVFSMLENLLTIYLDGTHSRDIKLWRVLSIPIKDLRRRAESVVYEVGDRRVSVENTEALIGGGALPEQPLPSVGISFASEMNAGRLMEAFRATTPPVIGRVENDRFLLDLKTVDESDLPLLADAIRRVMASLQER